MVDSGALNTLPPLWVAEAAGLDLVGVVGRQLAATAIAIEAFFATTRLMAANHTWEAEVGFCRPWPYARGLLGHISFFRYFTVTFHAVDYEFEVEPI
ncbi:MAG: hypothetical protein Q8Q52_03615 [Acidimicrobiia bacterium]|nr:hypothetical protein [Acidimicrobiia bacterium]